MCAQPELSGDYGTQKSGRDYGCDCAESRGTAQLPQTLLSWQTSWQIHHRDLSVTLSHTKKPISWIVDAINAGLNSDEHSNSLIEHCAL